MGFVWVLLPMVGIFFFYSKAKESLSKSLLIVYYDELQHHWKSFPTVLSLTLMVSWHAQWTALTEHYRIITCSFFQSLALYFLLLCSGISGFLGLPLQLRDSSCLQGSKMEQLQEYSNLFSVFHDPCFGLPNVQCLKNGCSTHCTDFSFLDYFTEGSKFCDC